MSNKFEIKKDGFTTKWQELPGGNIGIRAYRGKKLISKDTYISMESEDITQEGLREIAEFWHDKVIAVQ